MAKLRKPRPTEVDAELFLQHGSWGVAASDYVDPTARLAQLEEFEELFHTLWRQELRATRRLDLLILKSHVVVEMFLERLLFFSARNETDFEKERFTFVQKLTLAHAFALSPDPTLIPTLELLNRARNQIAHRLTFDVTIIHKMIRFNSELSPREISALTDAQRAAGLRRIVAAVCGGMVGAARAAQEIIEPRHTRGGRT